MGDPVDSQHQTSAPAGTADERSFESLLALHPWQLSIDDWWAVARRVWDQRGQDDVSARASAIAFSALFAIPTLLIAVVSVYGVFSSPADVTDLVQSGDSIIPDSANELITSQLTSITDQNSGALSLAAMAGFLGALWSVSGGVNRVSDTMNKVYGEDDDRPWYVKRAWSAFASILVVFVIVAALLLIAAAPALLDRLGVGGGSRLALLAGRWLVLGGLMIGMLGLLFRRGPKRSAPRVSWIAPGVVLAATAWIAMSIGFGIYVQNFGSYDATYGSLGSVIIFMMWLYLSAYIILLAGELNAELEHQTLADTTVDGDQPLGERGARVADSIPDDVIEQAPQELIDQLRK